MAKKNIEKKFKKYIKTISKQNDKIATDVAIYINEKKSLLQEQYCTIFIIFSGIAALAVSFVIVFFKTFF